jgi:NADPH:quinone reductase-like Zn-dependent oxidoreductase
MKSLLNKVAIVTGASSGIGRATALLFAHEGARVVVSARRAAELDALVNEIERVGGHARSVAGDICDEALAQRLVDMAVTDFGGLDIAVNNAGTLGTSRKVSAMRLDEWREVMDINLTSAFLGAKHQVPAMIERGGGSLIFRHGHRLPRGRRRVHQQNLRRRTVRYCAIGVTRHTVFDRSSATMTAPLGSSVTPTGRPMVFPSAWKPVTKSTGAPLGWPPENGTKTTL